MPAISPIGSIAKAFKLPKYKPFRKKAITDQLIKITSNHSMDMKSWLIIKIVIIAKIICSAKPIVANNFIPYFITKAAFIKLAGAASIEIIAKYIGNFIPAPRVSTNICWAELRYPKRAPKPSAKVTVYLTTAVFVMTTLNALRNSVELSFFLCSNGNVSGCRRFSQSSPINANAINAIYIDRQPKLINNNCPIEGAKAGTSTNMAIASDIT